MARRNRGDSNNRPPPSMPRRNAALCRQPGHRNDATNSNTEVRETVSRTTAVRMPTTALLATNDIAQSNEVQCRTPPSLENNVNLSTARQIITPTNANNQCEDGRVNEFGLGMGTQSLRVVLRSVVNTTLFRFLKFYDADVHGGYSTDAGSVCHLLVQECNVKSSDSQEWWHSIKGNLSRLITDHRNNVIKCIRKYYGGEFVFR